MKIRAITFSSLFFFTFVFFFKETNYGNCNSLSKYSNLIRAKTVGQHVDYWCWAAVGEMTMGIDQCVQANKAFQFHNCCDHPVPDKCNDRQYAPPFKAFNFNAKKKPNHLPLSWSEVKKQIDNGTPFITGWWISGENDEGHLAVVSGYCENQNEKNIYIRDPMPIDDGSSYWVTYDAYVQGINGGRHAVDYYDIKPK